MRQRSLLVSGLITAIGTLLLIGTLGLPLTDVGAGSHSEGVSTNSVTSGEGPVYVTTTYPVSETSPKASVNITIAPEEETITNLTIGVESTDRSHVDYNSFGISLIQPSGAAEPSESLEPRGTDFRKQYEISSLSPGERVEIQFEAYPTELQTDDNRIDVATVDFEFRRGGILQPDNAPGRISAATDMSNSPVELLNEHDNDSDSGSPILPIAGIILGIVGFAVGIGGVFVAKNSSGQSGGISRSTARSHVRSVNELKTRAQATGNDDLAEKAEEIQDEMEEDIKKSR